MNKNIALVLSGGGARGIAHIGVIEELEKQGYHIQSISGSSMGALVAATYVLGNMQAYKEWIYTLDKKEVFKLIDFSFSTQGLIKGDRLFKKIKEFIDDTNIEDLKIPFSAIATDITNDKEVVFDKGSIFKAVRASIAIPTVFTPVYLNDATLVDGGVINNIPLNRVKKTDNALMVAVHVNADTPALKKFRKKSKTEESIYLEKIRRFKIHLNKSKTPPKTDKLGYFSLLNKTISLMVDQMAKMTIEQYKPDILINISRDTCGTFDFYKARELVAVGKEETKRVLDRL
jgi:NTE family protein